MQPKMRNKDIPILYMPQQRPEDENATLVHAESLNALASLFGRDMQVHRHDRHYQLHYVDRGRVQLRLGDSDFTEMGPLFFITPPPIPHRFVSEAAAQWAVRTVCQSIIHDPWLERTRRDY